MKLFFIVIFAYAGYTLASNSTIKDYIDPHTDDGNVMLWRTLFTKLNILMAEVEKTNKRFDNLERRFEELNKRQNTDGEEESPEWTIVLRRQDGSVNFFRNWTEYKTGFGNPPDGELFIGLDNLHEITKSAPHELMFVMQDWEGEMRYASYDHFRISNEKNKYYINVLGSYTGDAGDALSMHKGMEFSTWDQDNDRHNRLECAKLNTGAWWFNKCYHSHLNGLYRKEGDFRQPGVGWNTFCGHQYSLKFVEMKIRPISL